MSSENPMPGKCSATARSGRPCAQPAVPGATVCRFHGGSAPQVAAAAAGRVAEQTSKDLALKAVADWTTDMVPLDPGDVLLKVTHVTWMQAAAHRAQLAAKEADGGNPFVRYDSQGREWPSALALLEQTERKNAADMAAKAVGADLMGRHLRLQERYGDTIAAVAEQMVREFAPQLDLTDPEVRRRIRRVLLTLAGEAA